MSYHWEIEIFYKPSLRRWFSDDLERTTYHGSTAYREVIEADAYEHGTTGSLALYYEDEETGQMRRSESIKYSDILGVNATRIGEPDPPEPPEIEEEDWDQETQ